MESYAYKNISASALIKTGYGIVEGIIINSHTSGTIKLWDNTSGATTVLMNTFTIPAVGEYTFPGSVDFSTGLYATIGGTADITLFWK